jgi:hypothetical protein
MERHLKDGILKSFCMYCEHTEVPSIFALWCGASTVSAALGRDCFIDMGHFKIYPNLYIVLIAGSARCRKSTSVSIASHFITEIEPKVKILSQKMTPEKLIESLSYSDGEEGGTQILKTAEGIVIVDELSTLIDKNAFHSGMIALLTTIYDSQESFTYSTRSRGDEIIHKPCLSILGASTEHWIKEAIPAVAIGGGFTSRVVFVYRAKPEKFVARPIMTEDNKLRGEMIKRDLNIISRIRGEFKLTDEAWKAYEKEYNNFCRYNSLFDNQNLSGYAGRRHVTLLKLAMVISASERDDRLIDPVDINIAINMLKSAEDTMPKVLNAITSGNIGEFGTEVLQIIVSQGPISRAKLLQKVSHKLSSNDLNQVMQTLIESELVEVYNSNGKTMYRGVSESFTDQLLNSLSKNESEEK